jgi:hypothetical protein
MVRSALSMGTTPITWLMLKTTYRPPWNYLPMPFVWRGRIHKHSPSRSTQADVELCERLINAFAAATDGTLATQETTGVWGWIFHSYQLPLAQAIEHRDASVLAEALASMFQTDFVFGLSPGSMALEHTQSWLGSRIFCMKCIDGLMSLAEALAVHPVKNPEQQGFGVTLSKGLPKLISDVEARLGFRLQFPDVGAPYGIVVDGRLITVETPEQVYGALRLDQAIKLHLARSARPLRIVEIGGGYGAMCYWFMRMSALEARYTIIDLPIVSLLQGYFLGRALGPDKIALYGEPAGPITLLPVSARAEITTPFDVLVNKDSMPEIPYDTVVDYLRWSRANCDGFFFSYNHESAVDFEDNPQGRVSDAVEHTGSFSRLRRERSWVRPGYVEEIYTPISPPTGLLP